MILSPEDKANISLALHMRANYIETGDTSLSRNDAIIYNEAFSRTDRYMGRLPANVKSLTRDQEELVHRLRDLAQDFHTQSI